MKHSFLLIILFTVAISQSVFAQKTNDKDPIKGISFLGPYKPPLEASMIEGLKVTNSEWVALIPQAIMSRETLKLKPDEENHHWSSTTQAQIQGIQLAKSLGLKVFLKPHIVLEKNKDEGRNAVTKFFLSKDRTKGAKWRGDFKAENDADWKIWEDSYEAYILNLAMIAESMDVEMFCVGTELRGSVVHRPQFWSKLIQKIRGVYSGEITYSANWDEYKKVTFWSELDYIGIDAYFPINLAKTPSVAKTVKNWKPIKKQLKALSKSAGRKILMTEFGYRNVSFSGALPWKHDKGKTPPNYDAQVNLYEAFFRAFWDEDWIAGGFSWNWIYKTLSKDNTDFTVENKPALDVIKKFYLE